MQPEPMSDFEPSRQTEVEVTIRYDGLTSDNHMLDLGSLAESIKGLDKILSIASEFSETYEYNDNLATHSVNVYAKETRANCFSFDAVVQFAQQHQLFAGAGGAILVLILQYIFAKNSNRKEEMKELSKNLELAISKLADRSDASDALVSRVLDSIDKMADSLNGAVRQAYHPIGKECETMSVACDNRVTSYSQEDKRNLTSPQTTIQDTTEFNAVISELDINSGACKVSINGTANTRINGKITDPVIAQPQNIYAEALSQQTPILLIAKAEISNGKIKKLHISDARA